MVAVQCVDVLMSKDDCLCIVVTLFSAMSFHNGLLTFADILISLFLIFPLSVLHWRGTWELQDIYFMPQDQVQTFWISFAIGGNVCILELLLQPLLIENLNPERRCLYFVVSRLHLYIHGWAVMCYWRGLWELCDLYLSYHWVNAVVMYSVCQLTMVITKTVRTAVGVPAAVSLDISDSLLEPDIVYKTPVNVFLLFSLLLFLSSLLSLLTYTLTEVAFFVLL